MRIAVFVFVIALMVSGCGKRAVDYRVDTPTAGHIKVAVDESLKPLVEAEIDAFEGLYQDAHIDAIYTSEDEALQLVLKDTARIAIVTRKIRKEEQSVLDTQRLVPNQVSIAKDGLALIVHKNNPDSLFSLDELKAILEGKTTDWKQLNPKGKSSKIEVVFDHPNSGIIRHLRDSLGDFGNLPANCFAVNTNEAVVDYVSKKENAIGLIGVSWISDNDDSTSNQFLAQIKVAGVKRGEGEYYQPYQAYIAQKVYPLSREIFMVSRETKARLGSGFVAFVASEKGQRVVLKLGLVPMTMPIRIVEVNREPIQ
jgi:phosphate transport system substrate-binding protein